MHRRHFLTALALLAIPGVMRAAPVARRPRRKVVHPDPRPGITAEKVLPEDKVTKEAARPGYAAAREFPEILDGIYCHCDCDERHESLRSLLGCFESDMATRCGICHGEGKLAGRLAREGKSLDEIRAAIDKRFGGDHGGSHTGH
jgi:hypothetical protein